MAKTYIPTLLLLVHKLCVYITRYRVTILEWLPDNGSKNAFTTMADACSDFLDFMEDFNHPV